MSPWSKRCTEQARLTLALPENALAEHIVMVFNDWQNRLDTLATDVYIDGVACPRPTGARPPWWRWTTGCPTPCCDWAAASGRETGIVTRGRASTASWAGGVLMTMGTASAFAPDFEAVAGAMARRG